MGTTTIYAATHQYGMGRTIRARRQKYLRFQYKGVWVAAKRVTIHIPARPFLGFQMRTCRTSRSEVEYAVRRPDETGKEYLKECLEKAELKMK